jgi:hypothetical protein
MNHHQIRMVGNSSSNLAWLFLTPSNKDSSRSNAYAGALNGWACIPTHSHTLDYPLIVELPCNQGDGEAAKDEGQDESKPESFHIDLDTTKLPFGPTALK